MPRFEETEIYRLTMSQGILFDFILLTGRAQTLSFNAFS